MSVPPNGVQYRLSELERRMQRLEDYEPAGVREQIQFLRDDTRELRDEVTWVKRAFIGMCITFAFSGVSLTLVLVGLAH